MRQVDSTDPRVLDEVSQSLQEVKVELSSFSSKNFSLEELKQMEDILHTIQNRVLSLKQDLLHQLTRQQKNESL